MLPQAPAFAAAHGDSGWSRYVPSSQKSGSSEMSPAPGSQPNQSALTLANTSLHSSVGNGSSKHAMPKFDAA